ncbi:DUF3558 family protein [Streptomyces sp. AJS327]|uniref:DUF3558 family protein n=1 Tax=Streptomyces sp. AJS327 TaxID=2545265 RepID=UPI0027E3D9BD|nr:DUF3558 domain-containing protein [Streptomyces sp. AJS327]
MTRGAIACTAIALPVLLVAGCSSDSGGDEGGGNPSADSSAPSDDSAPSLPPGKFKALPDACGALGKKALQTLVPNATDAGGKRLGDSDAKDASTCLWSGLKKYDYRQLTITLKRFDSDASLGPADKQAGAYLKQQIAEIKDNETNKGVKEKPLKGVGQTGSTLGFTHEKKSDKGKKNEFRAQHLVSQNHNLVVTVEYEGTGFEGGDLPSADTLDKGAEKAAQRILSQVS